MKSTISLQLVRYLIVGIGSNLINFIVYVLCYSINISLFASSLEGYSFGVFISYHFGRVWIFERTYSISKRNIIRFASVYIIGGLGMSSLIGILDSVSFVDYRINWLFGACFAVVNNFVGLKWFVFNESTTINGS